MQKKWLREEKIYNNIYLKKGIFKIVSIINWLPFLLYLVLLIIKKEEFEFIKFQFYLFLGSYIIMLLFNYIIFYLLGILSKMTSMIIYELKDEKLIIYDFNIKYKEKDVTKYLQNDKRINKNLLNRKIYIDLNNVKKVKIYPDKLKLYTKHIYSVYTKDKKIIKHITNFLKSE